MSTKTKPFRFIPGILLLAATCLPCAGQQGQPSDELTPQAVSSALIKQYCVGCHSAQLKTAGVALDTMFVDGPARDTELWGKVLHKVRARFMPPAGLPRPDEQAYATLTSYLEKSLDDVDAANPNPGRLATLRRLTRTEYKNAIRDLLALDVDVEALLPSDDSSFGFDNTTVGDLSPTLLERYLVASRKISRSALGRPVRSATSDTILVPLDRTQEGHLEGLPFGTRGGTSVSYSFPRDAEYDIQLKLTRDRDEHIEGLVEPTPIELMLDGQRIQLFTVEPNDVDITDAYQASSIPSDDFVDRHLHARIPVKAGPHMIGVTFPKTPSLLLETQRQPYQAHFNLYRHPRINPALHSITVSGPYEENGVSATPSRNRIFACYPTEESEQDTCAKRIFSEIARRAYRRPATDADLQELITFYQEGKAEGGFEGGIERGLRAILVSPGFLLRIEQDPPNVESNKNYAISDLELASRLSFFLWSSIPDDELLDLAVAKKLTDPAVLKKQVQRMLADQRSESLVTNFASQWLYLRNLDAIVPDARLFPDYDDNLRQSLRSETELFFGSIVQEDRSVLDLLSARYTFLNERLAKHYGIPNVYGSHFRRVQLGANSPRGGLLGQGSILTLTSYPDRTSPVKRGQWILTNILGSPPPPPPPNVPDLKEKGPAGKVMTVRERVAQHRANTVCAQCHNVMDPLGFGMENYDAVGRWRNSEDEMPIDASGKLADGQEFTGPVKLRNALLNHSELFVATLTEKLLTYALGRGLEPYDQAAVREIVRDANNSDLRFSALVSGVVNSKPFKMRRSQ